MSPYRWGKWSDSGRYKPNDGLFNFNVEQHWVIITKRTPDGVIT
jgi:hypothetical protein